MALRRFFLGGSGNDMMSDMRAKQKVFSLIPGSRRAALEEAGKKPLVLYFGTATYDSVAGRRAQADEYMKLDCDVKMLCCTRGPLEEVRVFDVIGMEAAEALTGGQMEAIGGLSIDEDPTAKQDVEAHTRGGEGSVQELISDRADIILVSGGNTLYAADKWKSLGFEPCFQAAMVRGAVLCGGSAGAICWFDAGHSDSGDPATWLSVHDKRYEMSEGEKASWLYTRIPGLGLLPGLCVPHGDKTQSNGVLRADDFDGMLKRMNISERGIHIDHWAAIVVCDEEYELWVLEGKEGSVLPDGEFSREREGAPGVWMKELAKGDDGEDFVQRTQPPAKGRYSDLFVEGRPQAEDENIAAVRLKNPLV